MPKGIQGFQKGHEVSEETRLKISLANKGHLYNKGRKHSLKTRRKLSLSHLGIKPSKETIEKKRLISTGKKLSEEAKHKISISKQKRKQELGYINSPETRKKIGLAGIGRIPWNKGKHLSDTHKAKIRIKTIQYLSSNRCIGIGKTYDTNIEILIEQELIKNKIPYMKQVPLEGIAIVDFLLSNKIIIQCDGNYWHSTISAKSRDINQDTILSFKGYKIFRFNETEIKKSPQKCLIKIMQNE